MAGTFEFVGDRDRDGDPEYVYYNALITNNRTDLNKDLPDPLIRFQETRGVPLVSNASKYVFSIIRANLNGPGKDLPIFIPKIRIGPTDNPTQNVNLTVYSITHQISISYLLGGIVRNQTFSSTQPIIYAPETQDITVAPVPLPSTTQTGQDVSKRYYWDLSYSHWLNLVNNAFTAAIADLQAQMAAYVTSLGFVPGTLGTVPSVMSYNPSNNLFTLYSSRYSFGGAFVGGATSFGTNFQEISTMWFNNNMYGLFAGFRSFYQNLSSERTNLIVVQPILNQNILNVAGGASYWVTLQDYESTSTLWSPIESIVFTSTMLPLVFEQTGDPVRFGDSIVGVGDTQVAFSPIITDISLTNTSASDYRGFIQYVPSAEYRLAAFQRSKAPIYNIDIQVFWRNRLDGQIYPVQMYNGSSVSVKIMLRRIAD